MGTLEAWVIIPSALWSAYFGYKLCVGIPDAQEKSKVLVRCLFGLAVMFGVGGYLSIFRISHSARPTVAGTINNLNQSGGKSPHSYIKLLTADGHTINLQCAYHGSRLRTGEAIEVTFLKEYSSVLQLKVITGSDRGWTLDEGDGLHSSYWSMYAGLFLTILAAMVLLTRNHR